jgi:ribose transport system permease protein
MYSQKINNVRKNLFYRTLNSILLIAIIVAIMIFFSIRSKDFFTLNNIITNIFAVSTIGIVCIGQTLLLISGTFDISVGSVVGFSGVILAKLLTEFEITNTWNSILLILVVVAVGCFIGFINGIIITKVGVNALITTIAMLSIVLGLSLVITKSKYISITAPFFKYLGSYKIAGIVPIPLILLIVLYGSFYLVLKTTVFGRYVYAIGDNELAAKYAGINVDKIRIILFTITSGLSAIAGILLASKLTSAQAIFGENYPLITVAACVLGGAALSGGRGGVLGSLLGIGFLTVLENGLILIGLPTYIQDLVTGFVLIIALYISEIWTRKT